MADSIQFRRGLRSTVKPLPVGMPGFIEDEERLVIGKGDGTNAELPNKTDIDNINSQMADNTSQGLGYINKIKSLSQDFLSLTPYPHLKKMPDVILKASESGWDCAVVESPCVWFDKNTQKYCMTYVGYAGSYSSPINAGIGLAWSDTPYGPWEKDKNNPILRGTGIEGDPDNGGCTGGTMWLENGRYYLFYIGLKGTNYEQNPYNICLATSTDLYNWERKGSVIAKGGDSWRQNAVYHSSIVKVKDIYYLFFNATGSDGIERIGLATSKDLYNWDVDDEHSPLITNQTSGWDSKRIGDPSVYFINDIWYMAYYGQRDDGKCSDGIAWTTVEEFPYNWRKYTGNPVLSPSEDYDSVYAHKPYVAFYNGHMYHFYTAVKSGQRAIALGTDDQNAIVAPKAFCDLGNVNDDIIVVDNSTDEIVTGYGNTIPFDTVYLDTANIFNKDTKTITCTKTGLYHLGLSLKLRQLPSTITGIVSVYILVRNLVSVVAETKTFNQASNFAGTPIAFNINTMVSLTKGDTIKCKIVNRLGTDIKLYNRSELNKDLYFNMLEL